jgi:preprotein translocase subunit SecG
MYNLVLFVHYVVCALMVVVILLQSGKGGGLAGAFGGGGSTIFGGRGAGTILTRATMVLGAAFFLTCITLALLGPSGTTTGQGKSLLQEEARRASGTQPSGGPTTPQRPGASTPGAATRGGLGGPAPTSPTSPPAGGGAAPGAVTPAPATSGQPAPAGGKH